MPLTRREALCWATTLATGLCASAQAADGLKVPDAAAVWPQWQLRLSRPQDPVSPWRHEAWWGGAPPAAASGLRRAAAPRLRPAEDTGAVAVAQSSL